MELRLRLLLVAGDGRGTWAVYLVEVRRRDVGDTTQPAESLQIMGDSTVVRGSGWNMPRNVNCRITAEQAQGGEARTALLHSVKYDGHLPLDLMDGRAI
jgi:hypothetical protein